MSNYIAPGVYVEENDYSQYVSNLATTIVGMVGTADKGPSNVPVTITSAKNYIDIFGQPNPNHYLGYAALAYLKQGSKLYVTRVAPSDAAVSKVTLPVPATYTPYAGAWSLRSNTATTATFVLTNSEGASGADELVALQTAATKLPGFDFTDTTGLANINGKLGSDLLSFVTQSAVDKYVKGRQFKVLSGAGKDASVAITNLVGLDASSVSMTVNTKKFDPFNSPVTTTATGSLAFKAGTHGLTSGVAVADGSLIAIIGSTSTGGDVKLVFNETGYTTVENKDALVADLLNTVSATASLLALEALISVATTDVVIEVPLYYTTTTISEAEAAKNATLVSAILTALVNAYMGTIAGSYTNLTAAAVISKVTSAAGITGVGSYDALTGVSEGIKSAEVQTDGLTVKLSAITVGVSGNYGITAPATAIVTATDMGITGTFALDLCRPTWVVSTAGSTVVPTLLKFSTLGEGDFSNLAVTILIDSNNLTSAQEQNYSVTVYSRLVSESVSTTSTLQADFTPLETYEGTPEVLVSRIASASKLVSAKLDYSTLDTVDYTTGTVVIGGDNDYLTPSFAVSPAANGISMLVGTSTLVSGTTMSPAFSAFMLGGSAGTLVTKYDILGDEASKTGIYSFGDPERIDVNLVLAPGWSADPAVAKGMISLCERRGDCMTILDTPYGLSVENVINYKRNVLNTVSNYAAIYYPWVKITDSTNKKDIFVPPSGLVAGQYAYNDKVGEVFTAPAGRTRGNLTDAIATERVLNLGDRELLAMAQINPIHTESGQGIFIRGQQTCQSATTALDRVNVRRLLLNLRKVIATASKMYEFEPGDAITALRLKQLAESILNDRLRKGAIRSYKVDVGPNVNTALVLENNELHMLIELTPAKTAERLVEVFNILGQGQGISVSV